MSENEFTTIRPGRQPFHGRKRIPADDQGIIWPAFFVGPDGTERVFNSRDEVPPGWAETVEEAIAATAALASGNKADAAAPAVADPATPDEADPTDVPDVATSDAEAEDDTETPSADPKTSAKPVRKLT